MGPVNPETPDQTSGPARRAGAGRRLAVAGVGAAVLAVGGVAVAQAATSNAPTPSAGPSTSASPGGSGAPRPREHSPHLAGTVVSASGGTITITDREGFQRTIHTTSATTYSDGLTATPAAGTVIVAEGTVDSDKTSLKATTIAKRPDRPGSGRGFPGGGPGRGFPGGRHHDGDPNGSATPSPGSSGTPGPGTPSPSPSTPSPSPTRTS